MVNKIQQMSKTRFWMLVWSLGLAGQLCWNIENQWFNTFVYAKIAKNSTIVTLMVITSALVTTFSTFLFGTLSDRRGSRRKFVSIGYILWGALTIAFGLTEFISSGNVGNGARFSLLAAVLVILADDVMSFFGSMANDSGYNAWSNDNTNDQNRGQVGAALAILPVIGTIVGTVVGGILIGSDDNYQRLFWAMGLFVIVTGLFSLFFLRDAPGLKPHKSGTFWQQFSAVFKAKGFFAQRELVLACVTTAVFFVAFNIYSVHMGNWMIYRVGFSADKMGVIQGVGLLLASLLVIPGIRAVNEKKIPIVAAMAVFLNIVGLILLSVFVRPGTLDTDTVFSGKNIILFMAVFLSGGGFVRVKELYPEESRGQFEGMRILFFTLIPMIIGTVIGNVIVSNGAGSVQNEYGIVENIPTESIYVWGAVLAFLTFIPLYKAARLYWKRIKRESESAA